jgi:TfoX/Sxy family transcriptional regulator of competence genes
MDKEDLGIAIREALADEDAITERRMFGGICFMKRRHMICGASGTGDLMLRVGKPSYEEVLAHLATRPMDFTGRPLAGYVYVDLDVPQDGMSLRDWVDKGLSFVATLPDKS